MDQIKKDIREIKTSVKTIEMTLIRNTASLESHIKRTNLLEKLVLGIILALIAGLISIVFKS